MRLREILNEDESDVNVLMSDLNDLLLKCKENDLDSLSTEKVAAWLKIDPEALANIAINSEFVSSATPTEIKLGSKNSGAFSDKSPEEENKEKVGQMADAATKDAFKGDAK
jgi:hypothetical protein